MSEEHCGTEELQNLEWGTKIILWSVINNTIPSIIKYVDFAIITFNYFPSSIPGVKYLKVVPVGIRKCLLHKYV